MSAASGVWLAFTTCPDEGVARRLVHAVVVERLAACGSILPGVTSIYQWQGAVETAAECLVLLKTDAARVDELGRRVGELHPYDVPEFLATPMERGLAPYLAWVAAETLPQVEEPSGQQ